MAKENNYLVTLLAFGAGVAIGANWDKIKPKLEPLLSSLSSQFSKVTEKGTRFVAEQKEKVEDTIAAAKISSAKKKLQTSESIEPTAGIEASEDIIVKRKKPSEAVVKPKRGRKKKEETKTISAVEGTKISATEEAKTLEEVKTSEQVIPQSEQALPKNDTITPT